MFARAIEYGESRVIVGHTSQQIPLHPNRQLLLSQMLADDDTTRTL